MRPGGLLFRVYNKTQQRLADNSALVLHLTDALTPCKHVILRRVMISCNTHSVYRRAEHIQSVQCRHTVCLREYFGVSDGCCNIVTTIPR